MRIRWTQPAVNDLTRLCAYLRNRRSVALAQRVALTVHSAAESLSLFPQRGRPGRVPETRELIIDGCPYIVIYQSRNETVVILRVLHGSQQWP